MKKISFFENAKLLYRKFGIIPLMYGSLGLEYVTNVSLDVDDVDILIPEAFVREKWNEFKSFLEKEGYALIDEHEHTFKKNEVLYSYASLEELEDFAGIKLSDIERRIDSGAEFYVLSPRQYLKVYKKSYEDGYRITVRKKKDKEKITFIESIIF